ncbi:MAG: polyprenyl synthetase [Crocinitomicaceae bacterium]|nr:polyprenyl synthetase [Crocinitomicaceae bacterium]|tara:strand:- start:3862 stop:4836 length:975 start_codon:yes stop_codon:yes gene_type:complete
MSIVDEIKRPIEKEMIEFETKFRSSMKSSVPLLDKITHYIVKRKGKQMRPMFVFLSAKMFGGVTDSSYHAASLIELLHTATLVHDDVVDDASHRRGFFSLNALWKNKIAVLVGDYLLSSGLLLAVDKNEFDLLRIVSDAVKQMSEGELLQIEKTRSLNMEESVYFEIIKAKTATLVGACCAAGTSSTGQSAEVVEKMRLLGEKAGIAFQIKDDLFDFGYGVNIGKPTGIDIKEKKTTLPLIYALNKSSYLQRRKIVNLVKNHNENSAKVAEVIEFVKQSGGIEYSIEKMNEFTNEAKSILREFPQNEANQSLEKLIDYTISRKK